MKRALTGSPDNPDYLYALSVLYIEWNRLDAALSVATTLRHTHPDLPAGRELINFIQTRQRQGGEP